VGDTVKLFADFQSHPGLRSESRQMPSYQLTLSSQVQPLPEVFPFVRGATLLIVPMVTYGTEGAESTKHSPESPRLENGRLLDYASRKD
jgi:hypothetical protein